jgi:hypothetical protein
MKKNYFYSIVVCLFLLSCKKDSNLNQKETKISNTIYGNTKIENGYLSFNNYDSFISALKNVYSLTSSNTNFDSQANGFVSMNEIYSNFNKELDDLEKLSEGQYFKGYGLLKEKYKLQINFSDNSFNLNCSGLAESYLVNRDGILKVGNDFLHFSSNSIETFTNLSYENVLHKIRNKDVNEKPLSIEEINQSGNSKEKLAYLYGSQAGLNSFTVSTSQFKSVEGNSGRALFIARAKIYNIHNSSFGNRGFITYQCNATHKNIFGTFRDVKYIAGTDGQINLALTYIAPPTYIFGDNNPRRAYMDVKIDIATAPATIDEGIKEFVVAASNALFSNKSALPNYVEFNDGVAGVNDDYIQTFPGSYWYSIESDGSIPILQAKSTFSAMIVGGAPLSYPSVTFPDLNMAY